MRDKGGGKLSEILFKFNQVENTLSTHNQPIIHHLFINHASDDLACVRAAKKAPGLLADATLVKAFGAGIDVMMHRER